MGDVYPNSAQGIRYINLLNTFESEISVTCLVYSLAPNYGLLGPISYSVITHESTMLAKFLQRGLKRLTFPDAYIWRMRSYRKTLSELFASNRYHCCIIAMTPFSLMSLGKFVKSASPNTILIGDFSDPFSFNMAYHRNQLKKKIAMHIEKTSFRHFDHIVVLNNRIRDKYYELYPRLAGKINVIEQGVDGEFVESVNNSAVKPKYSVRFLYAGAFYKHGRNPKNLYIAFTNLPWDVTLDVYGNIRRSLKPEHSENIIYHKAVSKQDLVQITSEADALILFDNKYGYQVPGKTLETLAVNKPVLLIYDNEDSPTLDYVKESTGVVWARNTVVDIRNCIEKIVAGDHEARSFDFRPYTWDKMGEKYLVLIRETSR